MPCKVYVIEGKYQMEFENILRRKIPFIELNDFFTSQDECETLEQADDWWVSRIIHEEGY